MYKTASQQLAVFTKTIENLQNLKFIGKPSAVYVTNFVVLFHLSDRFELLAFKNSYKNRPTEA